MRERAVYGVTCGGRGGGHGGTQGVREDANCVAAGGIGGHLLCDVASKQVTPESKCGKALYEVPHGGGDSFPVGFAAEHVDNQHLFGAASSHWG